MPASGRRKLAAALGCAALTAVLAGCGGSGAQPPEHRGAGAGGGREHSARRSAAGTRSAIKPAARGAVHAGSRHRAGPPPLPQVLPAASAGGPGGFAAAVKLDGRVAVLVSRTASGVTLLSFDQRLVELHLHSGTVDAGASGWRYGPAVAGVERRQLIAGFNGGFQLDTDAGGFASYGRVAVPLRAGLGSIVTYADGYTAIGSWHEEAPSAGHGPVVSVRQNLQLLIDHGQPAADLDCISCWGATLGGVAAPARSALGITARGRLVWAGGEQLTPTSLAQSLLGAGVVRAVQLDINPEWVAAYLYRHPSPTAAPEPIEMVSGAPGIPGQLLAPYSRDFFTVVVR